MVLPEQFRELMADVPSPVTVLTTWDDGPAGATIGAFIWLSMDPPLVLASVISGSSILGRVQRAGRFGVNLLAAHQGRVARQFSRRSDDRFDGVEWTRENGLPRLTGTAAWMECELHSEVPGGDHTVLIGLIRSTETTGAQALTYYRRSFGSHTAAPVPVWDVA